MASSVLGKISAAGRSRLVGHEKEKAVGGRACSYALRSSVAMKSGIMVHFILELL